MQVFFKYLNEKKGDSVDFLPPFCLTSCQISTLLGYFWETSRDWETKQRTTTQNVCTDEQFSV